MKHMGFTRVGSKGWGTVEGATFWVHPDRPAPPGGEQPQFTLSDPDNELGEHRFYIYSQAILILKDADRFRKGHPTNKSGVMPIYIESADSNGG